MLHHHACHISVFCEVFYFLVDAKPFNICIHLLMQLELFLSSGTLSLSLCSLVTGLFGVNIPYTWNQDHNYLFKWVSKLLLLCTPCAANVLTRYYEQRIIYLLYSQVVMALGLFGALTFLLIIGYARKKGLVGS